MARKPKAIAHSRIETTLAAYERGSYVPCVAHYYSHLSDFMRGVGGLQHWFSHGEFAYGDNCRFKFVQEPGELAAFDSRVCLLLIDCPPNSGKPGEAENRKRVDSILAEAHARSFNTHRFLARNS